jgi:hypothetical protein
VGGFDGRLFAGYQFCFLADKMQDIEEQKGISHRPGLAAPLHSTNSREIHPMPSPFLPLPSASLLSNFRLIPFTFGS